jgi:hypothetical protein
MRRFKLLICMSLVFSLFFISCGIPVVKGNIYRAGFKDGKLPSLLDRFHKGTYAIFPFKGIFENRMLGIATDGNAISDLISIQMLYHGYKVLERDKMQKILEEKSLKLSGLVENPPETKDSSMKSGAVMDMPKKAPDNSMEYMEIGRMLGVDFIVTGSIIQYEMQFTNAGLFGGSGQASLAVTITTRIVDVQNGDIIFAMSAGTNGNNLPEALDRITMAFTDALKEGKVYVWE